jgi:4-amino-4-deoxy-L-arabinose transferase-like glycosyltransferase
LPSAWRPALRAIPPARAALVLIAASVGLHVLYGGLLALSPQEAYYWAWSRRLALSYFDHPPLAAWTIRLATEALGASERAIRLAAAGHAALFLSFLFLAGRRLFGARAALLALGLTLIAPITSLGQVIITPDGPLLSGWAAALYFTVRALDEERGGWLLLAGLATGCAALGKYTALLLVPQIALALLLDARGRRLLASPWPWLGAAVAAGTFAPVLLWNAGRGWISFQFQGAGRLAAFDLQPALLGRFLGVQALALSPLLWLGVVAACLEAARRWRQAPFRVAAIFSAPLLLLLLVVSPFHGVKENWAAPAYLSGLLALGALALERWHLAWARRLTLGGAGLAAAGALLLHLLPLWPDLPFPPQADVLSGWRQLAGRVEAERLAIGGDPVVVGCTYKPAAELMYYLPDRPWTQSAGLLGRPGLQFDEWLDPGSLRGRAAILVGDPREGEACRGREALCHPLQPLAPEEVWRGGRRVTAFALWRCWIPAGAALPLPGWRLDRR